MADYGVPPNPPYVEHVEHVGYVGYVGHVELIRRSSSPATGRHFARAGAGGRR